MESEEIKDVLCVLKTEEFKKKDGLVSPVCESSPANKQIESNGWIRNICSLHDQKNTCENMKKDFFLQISGENVNKAVVNAQF